MANNFPVLPVLQVASLQYTVTIPGISGPVNSIPAGQMNLVNFEFETAPDGDGVLQFNYAGFDQDTHEAGVKQLLNGICTAMAANLGVSLATVQAALVVHRVWALVESAVTGGIYPGLTVTDVMTYP
jgi:hypothetical protein